MANKLLLLCLVLVFLSVLNFSECGRGFGRSRSSGRSSYSSRSYSRSKPSSSSIWTLSKPKPAYTSSHSYPSSSGKLSGFGSVSSSGSGNKFSYPSSSSGLSGVSSSNSKHSYPSSSGILSGSSSGFGSKFSYPSSSSGLSGSGSQPVGSANKYPLSSSGLSGAGSPHSPPLGSVSRYPLSPTGLSGAVIGSSVTNSNKYKPSLLSTSGSSSGVHTYPSSSIGFSGAGSQPSYNQPSRGFSSNNNYKPSHETVYHPNTFSGNRGYGSGIQSHGTYQTFSYPPTYYTSPQYVYISQYRNSGSRYSDILTGLALYNLGRSHTHHYHDHYYYDDYYRRKYYDSSRDSNYRPEYKPKGEAVCTFKIKENDKVEVVKIPCEIVSTFTQDSKTIPLTTDKQNSTICMSNTSVVNNTQINNLNNSSTVNSTTSNIVITNTTSCTSIQNATDPLRVQGPTVDMTNNMECFVEIIVNNTRLVQHVDCKTLIEYSKVPEPKKESVFLPSKDKLKSWISNPPWWMSLFIAT